MTISKGLVELEGLYVTGYSMWNVVAYLATNPPKSLTGSYAQAAWLADVGTSTNQRFHIDLGSAKIIKRIYYENVHHNGGTTTAGVKNFTFWGSNTAGDFADLVYLNDGTWVDLTLLLAQSTFDQHVALDQADPKYIVVTNSTAYRYYAFKFADNYGEGIFIGVRRIELQTEDIVGITWNGITITKWNGVTITIPINTQ